MEACQIVQSYKDKKLSKKVAENRRKFRLYIMKGKNVGAN